MAARRKWPRLEISSFLVQFLVDFDVTCRRLGKGERPGEVVARTGRVFLLAVAAALLLAAAQSGVAAAAGLPSGFQDNVVFSGLNGPVNLRFSPDGRVFVAQRNGQVKVYANLAATTPDDPCRPRRRGSQLLGPRPARARARPGLPDQPIRLRALHLRRPAGRHRARVADRQLSRRRRGRRRTAALSAAGSYASRSPVTPSPPRRS